MEFKDEKEFQIWLGKEIKKYNFEVFTDKKICELPTFHGDTQKPDLLIFYKECKKENKQISINSPFALELKIHKNQTFSHISKAVTQIEKYFDNEYYTKENNWNGKIKNIFLATPESIFEGIIYNWNNNEQHNKGIDWTIRRILWSLSNSSGVAKRDNSGFYIELHNSRFYLLEGGILGDKPWNIY